MATQNRNTLKSYFNEGDRPTEEQFADFIDSAVNAADDKAVIADVSAGTNNTKYVTASVAKSAIIQLSPVKTVNSVGPDTAGNISITNVSTAGTITGNINKSQVTGLQADLDAKQNLLVSGTNIKTIDGVSLLGSGNITLGGAMIASPKNAFTLSNNSGLQDAFPTGCRTFALQANKTYFFKGKYLITKDATVAHIDQIGWGISGGLAITAMEYAIHAISAATNTLTTASFHVNATGSSTRSVNTSNSMTGLVVEFEGTLICTNGGNLTPKIAFSAAVQGSNIMRVGSYVEFREIGSDTFQASPGVS